MDQNEIRDLAQVGIETLFEDGVDTERAKALATTLATWCFETISNLTEDEDDTEEIQIQAITNAIAAAYFAGLLDSEDNPTNPQETTISGKSGSIVNIYIS